MRKWDFDAKVMQMRSLGYSQKEIAERFKVSQATIHNILEELRGKAEKKGVDLIFYEMCAKLYLPKVMRLFK